MSYVKYITWYVISLIINTTSIYNQWYYIIPFFNILGWQLTIYTAVFDGNEISSATVVLTTTWNLYLCTIVRRLAYVIRIASCCGNAHLVLRIPDTARHYLSSSPFNFYSPLFSVLLRCVVEISHHRARRAGI